VLWGSERDFEAREVTFLPSLPCSSFDCRRAASCRRRTGRGSHKRANGVARGQAALSSSPSSHRLLSLLPLAPHCGGRRRFFCRSSVVTALVLPCRIVSHLARSHRRGLPACCSYPPTVLVQPRHSAAPTPTPRSCRKPCRKFSPFSTFPPHFGPVKKPAFRLLFSVQPLHTAQTLHHGRRSATVPPHRLPRRPRMPPSPRCRL
jgi:hypothetical protein